MFSNNTSDRRIPRPIKGLFFLAMLALFFFILGNVIVFLWNEVLVKVTDFKTITFWQAIGLFVLARILFGGFRFGAGGGSHRWQKSRKAWRGKWMRMSEEERAEFKSKWRERCGKRNEH
ncbi:MAG: hypothetical protein R3E32_18165 [Chitinophagales bacterium]